MSVAGHKPVIKGHLGQKSSVLAPSACKLTQQMLVQQHLTAHYKKLSQVKSSIDTTCPKSVFSNARARDQLRKEQLNKRPSSARPFSSRRVDVTNPDGRNTARDDASISFSDDPEIDRIVRQVLLEQEQMKQENTTNRWATGSQTSARSSKGYRLPDYAKYGAGNPPRARPEMVADTYGGDVLEKHAEKFTEAREYTPRTLKRPGQSKLTQSKYYNRPPPPPPNASPKSEIKPNENEKNDTKNKNQFIFKSNQASKSRNASKENNQRHASSAGPVPSLNIQEDPDKVLWLKQQAEQAKLRQEILQHREVLTFEERSYFNPLMNSENNQLSESVGKMFLSETMQQYKKDEEELMYLNFISDVTNDILTRGIFTNTVLLQVFEDHVERNKTRLKISKMREMLGTIRTELGIPLSDSLLEGSYGYKSTQPLQLRRLQQNGNANESEMLTNKSIDEDELNDERYNELLHQTLANDFNSPPSHFQSPVEMNDSKTTNKQQEIKHGSTSTVSSDHESLAGLGMTLSPDQLNTMMMTTTTNQPPNHAQTTKTNNELNLHNSFDNNASRSVRFAKDHEIYSTRDSSEDVSVTEVTSIAPGDPKPPDSLIFESGGQDDLNSTQNTIQLNHRSNSNDTLNTSFDLRQSDLYAEEDFDEDDDDSHEEEQSTKKH